MEDSGIDSGDVTQNKHNNIESIESDDSTNNNLSVAFKGISNSKSSNDINVIIKTNALATGKNRNSLNSSCRTLQRKLELKVERAKRNYSQLHDSYSFEPEPNNSTLIPINRLQIPGCQENVPLVEYKSANSDDDDDDEDEIAYFQVKSKHNVKHDLSDTFSLQEMTIMGTESDDSESQTLEFMSPSVTHTNLDKLFNGIPELWLDTERNYSRVEKCFFIVSMTSQE